MSPYSGRAAVGGPPVALSAKAAQSFGLAVHELATNSAKYGALSNMSGRVEIAWQVDEAARFFVFRWQERGGPKVRTPERKGFGTAVLKQVMAEYCDATPRLEFSPHGLVYEVTCRLDVVAGGLSGT